MNAWIHVAGWVLLHFVWQGSVLAIAAAIVLRLSRPLSSPVRYAIACGTLIAMLLAVIATAGLITASAGSRVGDARPVTSAARPDAVTATSVQRGTFGSSAARIADGTRVETAFPWIVSAWLIGVGALLVRTGTGWLRVRRLHQLALSSNTSSWQSSAKRIAARLGLDRIVRIVELPHIDVPLVVGCMRPIVVLPIAAMSQLNPAQVEAILAHELAHIRRHDYVVNLIQTLAETFLFYHPGVWWLSGRIRDEREHCCDDVAVAVCGDPVVYAEALTELEAWRSGVLSLAPAATGGSLLNRIRRILRADVSERSQTSPLTITIVAAAIVATIPTLYGLAQTAAPAPAQQFEVASVRRNTSGDNKVNLGIQPGGRFTATNVPLILLIRSAYQVQPSQLIGAPDWGSEERYDIVAKAEAEFPPPLPGGPPSAAQLMLQSLLQERFKLVVHRETRDLPIYALVLARKDRKLGPQLTPSTTDCAALNAARGRAGSPPVPPKPGEPPLCGIRMGFGQLTGNAFPLANLANSLSQVVQGIVVDQSGLSDNFDFDLKWTPDKLPPRPDGLPADQPVRMNGVDIDPNGPSIFTAVQEQLGLKLESTRGPVDVLVIDKVERPTPD